MAAFVLKSVLSKAMVLHEIGRRLPIQRIPVICGTLCLQPSRHMSKKHYHPDYRRHRWAKVLKIDLPDFDKIRGQSKMSVEEQRAKQKKEGLPFPRSYRERDIVIASTSSIFEPYVPPEGDGRASVLSGTGAIQTATEFGKKGKSMNESRKIKKFDEDFDRGTFAQQAQDIYVKAHELLNELKDNEEEMHDFVTEKAFPEMTEGLEKKTVRWHFVESLEPPRVVYVRTTNLITKDNIYGQVTVRFHSRQTLSIYDRFGRLMYGGEKLIKDCLEYVVFEKHLADEYGRWRLHAKIVPEWMPPVEPVLRTMRKPEMPDVSEENTELVVDEKIEQSGQQVATV